MTLTQILLIANLVALAALGAGVWLLHRRATTLRAGVDWLAGDVGALPDDRRAQALEAGVASTPFYTLEILNPLEVAAQYSKLGKVFAGLTPQIVRYEVYRQAHGIIGEQLAERGIKAEVRLHR